MKPPSDNVVALARWLDVSAAVAELGVKSRQLRRRAVAGTLERRKTDDGRTQYLVPCSKGPALSVTKTGPETVQKTGLEFTKTGPQVMVLGDSSSHVDDLRQTVEHLRVELAQQREAFEAEAERLRDRVEYLERHVAEDMETIGDLGIDLERAKGVIHTAAAVWALRTDDTAAQFRKLCGLSPRWAKTGRN